MALRPATRFHMHRGHKLKTAPAIEPVTAAEFKAHIVDDGMSDADANAWIEVARQLIEDNTGIAMISQVWELTFDRWPSLGGGGWWDGVREGAMADVHGTPGAVELPRYPLQDVGAVTTYDTSGAGSPITVADFFDIDTYSTYGRMSLRYGATWPIALRPTNAILIEYTAGYGSAAADVPAPLKLAVKQVAAYLYNHRGDGCDPKDALAIAGGILGQYKVRSI